MKRFFQVERRKNSHGQRTFSRLQIGSFHINIYHKNWINEIAFHDHPYDFWEVPLNAYVEEVLEFGEIRKIEKRIVPAYLPSFRFAEHKHRVVGPWKGRFSFFNSIYEAGAFDKPVDGEQPYAERGMIVVLAVSLRWRRAHGRYYVDKTDTRYVETESHE